MIDLGGLVAYFRADMKDLQTKVVQAQRLIRDFGRGAGGYLKANEENFRRLGRAAQVAAAGIAAAAGVIVKATADIEQGYIEIAKRTGFAGSELQEFANGLKLLSVQLRGITLGELQNIAAAAGQLGIRGQENILKFTRAIAMMGVATDLSAEQAATGMARLTNVMGEGIGSVETLGSVMNELSNNTTATTSDLLELSLRMGAAARSFGLTSAETLALAASIRDAGSQLEAGGSAMIQVFGEMLADIENFASVTGVSMDRLSELIRKEPVEAIKLVVKQLSEMDKIAQTKALEELGLSGVRVAQVMRGLAGSMENLDKNLALANAEAAKGTSLFREYSAASDGLKAKFKTAGDTVKQLGGTIGGLFINQVKDFAESIIRISYNLSVWIAANQDTVTSLGEVVKYIAIAAGAVGVFQVVVTGLKYTVVPVLSLLAKTAAAVATGFAAMSAPVVLAAGAILAIAGLAYTFRAAWNQNILVVKDNLQSFFDAWKDGMDWLKNMLADTLPLIGTAFVNLFESLKGNFHEFVLNIAGSFSGVWAWIKKVKDGIVDAWDAPTFKGAMNDFMRHYREAGAEFGQAFMDGRDVADQALADIKTLLKDSAETTGVYLKAFAEAETEHLADLFAAMKKQAGDDFEAIITMLKTKIPVIGSLFEQLNEELPDFMTGGQLDSEGLRARVEEIFQGIAEAGKEGLDDLDKAFYDYTESYVDHMMNASKRIQYITDDLFYDMISGTKRTSEAFRDFGRSLVQAMTRTVSEMMSQWILFQTFTQFGKIFGSNILTAMGQNLGNPFATTSAATKHSGGYVGIGGLGRAVPAFAFANAPRLHNGLGADEFPAILQRGEKVVPKGGSGGDVNIVINNNTPTQMQAGKVEFDGENYIVGLFAKHVHNNGPLRGIIQQASGGG